MSGQRARSAVAADHRSVHPDFPGVPWWGAILIALTATAVGFAFDAGAGNKELSMVFAASYIVGCVLAVLAVRQAGLFTAVIQPPIVLFVTVPGSYFLFHGGQILGLKDLAINCGYPLIERFPLMFFTSAAVLLIGMGRWYHGMSARRATPPKTTAPPKTTTEASPSPLAGLMASVSTKLTALVTGRRLAGADADEAAPRPRKRPAKAAAAKTAAPRAARAARTADGSRPRRRSTAEADAELRATRSRRSTKGAPPRKRSARAADTEYIEPVAERPRRSRAGRPGEPMPPAEPRRRSRSQAPRDRTPPPRDRRLPPREARRPSYDAPSYDTPSYDDYEPFEPRPPRPRRASRFGDYEPLEPHDRTGRRSSTHHPVSRVRYRGAEDGDDRAAYRSRPRRAGHARSWEADSWEYDI